MEESFVPVNSVLLNLYVFGSCFRTLAVSISNFLLVSAVLFELCQCPSVCVWGGGGAQCSEIRLNSFRLFPLK